MLDWSATEFAAVNLVLALFWIVLAWTIGLEFTRKAQENVINVAPQAGTAIPRPARPLGSLPSRARVAETSPDADPATCCACTLGASTGSRWPHWIEFRPRERLFAGVAPIVVFQEITVVIVASDVDGLEAQSTFVIRAITV